MQDINLKKISIDPITIPDATERGIEMDMLRLDKIHPQIPGNKWFKLRYYLEEAKRSGKKKVLSFGGAWSNHLLATAAACKLNGLQFTAIIRGERSAVLSAVIKDAMELGMQPEFVSREDYSNGKLPSRFLSDEFYRVPQGGYGIQGMKGAATILDLVNKEEYTHICCATGTGTMLAGLTRAATPVQQLIGISVLKNHYELEEEIRKLVGDEYRNYSVNHDHHFGGYAKYTDGLIKWMNDWYRQTGIPTDFVYTGKLCFAVHAMIRSELFKSGSRILLIHSGGLSGNRSLEKGTLIF